MCVKYIQIYYMYVFICLSVCMSVCVCVPLHMLRCFHSLHNYLFISLCSIHHFHSMQMPTHVDN